MYELSLPAVMREGFLFLSGRTYVSGFDSLVDLVKLETDLHVAIVTCERSDRTCG